MQRAEFERSDGVIAPFVRTLLASAIAGAGGNEVFFFGTLEQGVVVRAIVVARGNDSAVPVFLERAGEHNLLIHNHPGGDLTPSPADLNIASDAGTRSLGFYIIDNDATHVYRVVEPAPKKEEIPLDEAEIREIFSARGLLDRAILNFEERAGQRDLALAVTRAFNRREVAAFEGGTGIGKTYAYLVPAILWAVRNRKRVVVSTQTIALGEQLLRKDLPQLRRVLPDEFTFALIKGRANYVCRRKAADVARQPDLFASEDARRHSIDEILAHLARGGDGSRDALPRLPPPEVWGDFESTTDQSLKVRCKFYGECFYYEARRRAFHSNIVVVNHHLFFADLAVRRAAQSFDHDLVIPAYRRVILDEAHRIEEVAAQHLGAEFSEVGLLRHFSRLAAKPQKKEDGGRGRGRFPYVAARLASGRGGATRDYIEFELLPHLFEGREQATRIFGQLRAAVEASVSTAASRRESETVELPVRNVEAAARAWGEGEQGAAAMVRVGTGREDLPPAAVAAHFNELLDLLAALRKKIRDGRSRLLDEPFQPQDEYEGLLAEFRAALGSTDRLIGFVDQFLDATGGMISWVEISSGKRRNLIARRAPVRVAAVLEADLYRAIDSVVQVSATLSIDGKWDFLGDRLGWTLTDSARFHGEEFPSPFDYKKQVLLALPTDLPEPGESGFEERFASALIEIVRAVRGRTFVLFTSHGTLRKIAARITPAISAAGYPILVQGTTPRSELLERFRTAGNAVLLGNQSFWEGVDVPGPALSCVVIARLPFRVPTHPLERGRAEEIEARGENPFARLTVPQAALALKQGFGRLIRTRLDRGAVVIADRRITTKGYGKSFLRSLPPASVITSSWAEVSARLTEYFQS